MRKQLLFYIFMMISFGIALSAILHFGAGLHRDYFGCDHRKAGWKYLRGTLDRYLVRCTLYWYSDEYARLDGVNCVEYWLRLGNSPASNIYNDGPHGYFNDFYDGAASLNSWILETKSPGSAN